MWPFLGSLWIRQPQIGQEQGMYSWMPNKRVYSIIIFRFFPPPYSLKKASLTHLCLPYLFFRLYFPTYLFIRAYLLIKFTQNIHPTRLLGPTRLIGT